MLVSQVIADVRSELLEPVAGFWTPDELLRWANVAELDFVNQVRGLDGISTASSVAAQANYPLLNNFLSSKLVLFDDLQGSTHNWTRLKPTTLEKMSQEHPDFLDVSTEKLGVPSEYMIWRNEIWLYPVPKDTGQDIKLFHKVKPTSLTDVSQSFSIDDSLCPAITAFILWKAWSKEKETAQSQKQESEYMRRVGEGRRFYGRLTGDLVNQIDVPTDIPYRRA